MRLLCCADTHGSAPPDLDEHGAVAWLHAGDVENGPDVDVSMREIDPRLDPLLSPVVAWLDATSLPVHIVRGNHDCVDVYRFFKDDRDVSGRVVALAPGVWLAGIGWHGERHYELPLESDLAPVIASVERQLLHLTKPRHVVIVLTHYPPAADAMRPRHASGQPDSQAVRDFIDRVRPLLVVEGHVHRRAGESFSLMHNDGSTTIVVNPGPGGCVVEIDALKRRAIVRPSSLPPHPDSARP